MKREMICLIESLNEGDIFAKNIGTGDLEDHVKDEFYKGNPKLKD